MCAGVAECRDRSDDTLAMCADTQRLQMGSVVGIRHVAQSVMRLWLVNAQGFHVCKESGAISVPENAFRFFEHAYFKRGSNPNELPPLYIRRSNARPTNHLGASLGTHTLTPTIAKGKQQSHTGCMGIVG